MNTNGSQMDVRQAEKDRLKRPALVLFSAKPRRTHTKDSERMSILHVLPSSVLRRAARQKDRMGDVLPSSAAGFDGVVQDIVQDAVFLQDEPGQPAEGGRHGKGVELSAGSPGKGAAAHL